GHTRVPISTWHLLYSGLTWSCRSARQSSRKPSGATPSSFESRSTSRYSSSIPMVNAGRSIATSFRCPISALGGAHGKGGAPELHGTRGGLGWVGDSCSRSPAVAGKVSRRHRHRAVRVLAAVGGRLAVTADRPHHGRFRDA